jgi:hypothetical protein
MSNMKRSFLASGPASVSITQSGASAVVLHLIDDAKLGMDRATVPVTSAVYGDGDEVTTDLVVKATGTPMLYDNYVGGALPLLFPFSSVANGVISIIPLIGQSVMGMTAAGATSDTDVTAAWQSPNNDIFTLGNVGITKPPDIVLSANKPILGSVEISGLIKSSAVQGTFANLDPSATNAWYTTSTGSYGYPTPTTKNLARGIWTAAWAAASLTNFQTQDGFTITHEFKIEPRKIYGDLTFDFILTSWRVMCKCTPISSAQSASSATMAIIQAAQQFGGSAGSIQGQRLSSNTSTSDLIISAQTESPTSGYQPVITIKNAALKTAGFVFGAKPLRIGEIGFVSTWGSGGPVTGGSGFPPLMTLK